MKCLLDTNQIIEAINNGYKLPREDYIISFITELELLSFSRLTTMEELKIRRLLSNFCIVDISDNIKAETIRIRKLYNFKLPDSIIVATAIAENTILFTNDKQLFQVEGLKIKRIREII